MKKIEKESPNSWIFEQDISKAISYNYNRKYRNFTIFVLIILLIVAYCFFNSYYGDAKKVGTIIIAFGSAIILMLYLAVWILKKRIVNKYWPMIIIPVVALLIIRVVVYACTKEIISLPSTDVLSFCGAYLSFLGTFCLGYFIYMQDRLKMIEEKRTKIRLLLALIENANIELLRLSRLVRNEKIVKQPNNSNYVKLIPYNSDWLLYYYEYEALKGENSELRHTVTSFFDNIMNVNEAIKLGQIEEANEINHRYVERECYSTSKYNELEAITCLQNACEDFHFLESKSWIERKETVDLINKLCKKYYFIIENYIYVWLIQHNVESTTEKDNLNYEMVDWLLLNSPEIKEIIKYPTDKRIISKMIFDCSLKFNCKSKKINFIWGEYSLK